MNMPQSVPIGKAEKRGVRLCAVGKEPLQTEYLAWGL